ncbi:MAG: CopG family transcriptional regulator [Gemmatimonadetes bacterium]|nr:CopG family transcriptional regulator [Gemmatimonadota bacterium]
MAATIQLAPEAEKRIDSLVARTGHSKDFFLREIIKRGLEDVEDYYLAADLLEGVREDTKAVYSNNPS